MNINLSKSRLDLDLDFLDNRQNYADHKGYVKAKQNKSVFKREKINKYTL